MLTTNSTTTESSNLHSQQQQQHQETNTTTSTKPSQSQVTFNLNPKSPLEGIETSHQQQNNNSNFLVYTPSDLAPNSNLMMRRDRSLDRCTMTESYFDPDTGFTSRRSYLNTSNVSSSQLSTPQQPNFPAYVNSTLYLSNNIQQQQSYKAPPSTRQHHRSNSILTNPNLGSTSNAASFNPLGAFINRDSGIDSGGGVNSNGVYTGLRSSRALSSSTNFTSIGFLGRDSSTNSVNLPNESNSSVQNNSNTQQVAFFFSHIR